MHQVAQRFIAAVKESNAMKPPLRAFIMFDEEDILQQGEQQQRRLPRGANDFPSHSICRLALCSAAVDRPLRRWKTDFGPRRHPNRRQGRSRRARLPNVYEEEILFSR